MYYYYWCYCHCYLYLIFLNYYCYYCYYFHSRRAFFPATTRHERPNNIINVWPRQREKSRSTGGKPSDKSVSGTHAIVRSTIHRATFRGFIWPTLATISAKTEQFPVSLVRQTSDLLSLLFGARAESMIERRGVRVCGREKNAAVGY